MTEFSFHHSGWYLFMRRHWLTAVFLMGFVTDYLLLNRIDDKFDNGILLFYVVLSTASILLFYVGVAEKVSLKWSQKLRHFMPALMQYSFGGLLSGMLIFYGRSGDLSVSYPFLILIIVVIIINELLSRQSDRLLYNLAVYFIGLFSYCVLVVPVVVDDMGDIIFIGSGFVSLAIMYAVVRVLAKIIPNFLEMQKRGLIFIISSIYVLFNTFYFLNIIPPIPLSLTELSVYQSVERTSSGGYRIIKESDSWFEIIPFVSDTFHPIEGQGISCFARVYAPTNLTTDIVHRWEFLDESGDWIEHFTTSYKITGENKRGYRGFTNIKNIHDGEWRCGVETKRGQVLGRLSFTVDTTKAPVNLVTVLE
jgi:hypothetical protein